MDRHTTAGPSLQTLPPSPWSAPRPGGPRGGLSCASRWDSSASNPPWATALSCALPDDVGSRGLRGSPGTTSHRPPWGCGCSIGMPRRLAREEDSTNLIDMVPGAKNKDSYGSTASTSQVKLRRQPLASPPGDPGPRFRRVSLCLGLSPQPLMRLRDPEDNGPTWGPSWWAWTPGPWPPCLLTALT